MAVCLLNIDGFRCVPLVDVSPNVDDPSFDHVTAPLEVASVRSHGEA